jgi:phosphopantothenoylcysteine decarboxylase/phosphopantothenate--cysteine ligase
MRCVVTAGPTYEPLDQVRRLTNFSTGRLGSELVNFLAARGHEVILLIGQLATWRGERHAARVETFTTTADLSSRLRALATERVDAVFHAAAVSDFSFGTAWGRSASGELTELKSGKLTTRQGTLLVELVPTQKIIAQLRGWFPQAQLVGWKYEVDGDRAATISAARTQLTECRTDACVANGPAYGEGFGVVKRAGEPRYCPDMTALFGALEAFTGGKSAGQAQS